MPQCGMAETNKGTLAVDLDKTLAKSQEPFSVYTIGEPVPEILQAVRDEIATGRRVVIFTARAASNDPGVMRAVREWLTRHDLGELKITCQKTPDITEFWDDRAKPVTPNEGFTEKEAMQMVPLDDLLRAAGSKSPQSNSAPPAISEEAKEASRRDGLRNLWLRKGQCPECGGAPESIHPDDAGDVKCSKCHKKWELALAKSASATPRTLLHYIPNTALAEARTHGLLSSVALMQRPDLLEKARPDPKERKDWLAFAEKQKESPHRQGPNALFQGPPSTLKLPDNHPSKSVATTPVRILIDQLMQDHPTTRLHGLELMPYETLQGELSDAEWDAKWEAASDEQRDAWRAQRKHDLTPEEFENLMARSPEELWQHYRDPGKPMYAPDVPHVAIITPTGIIDPKYLDFGDAAPIPSKQAADYTETVPKPLKHFARPENWDPYDKLGDVELLCGSNDWECANTWLWAEGDGQRVWIELKFPKNHPCFEKYTDDDEAEWKAHADAAKKAWLAAAKSRKTKSDGYTIDSFAAALGDPDMKQYIAASGTDKLRVKEASAAPPTTGPHALVHALKSLDLDALEKEARDHIASGKITRRDKGVKMLNVLQGLKRNNIAPQDLMITRVPVLPAAFRPYAMMGSTYIPGAANELYGDLFKHKAIHEETVETLGEGGAGLTRRNLYGAVRALYGYGEPVSPKLLQRGTQGYLHEITGDSPKFGFVNRRLVSKPIDSVGRSVITVNPELDMNQIGIPEEMAWDMLGSLVQRRLSRTGMPLAATIKHVKDRSREARQALDQELKERPVIYSRSPAWHKFNTIAGYAQIHGGNDVQISPYVTAGHNADFDGDQINVNFPIMPASVQEAKDKLMPDKMLFTIKDPEATMSLPKHEMLLSLAAAAARPSLRHHIFPSRAAALDGIKRGTVKLEDSIEFPD